jgi:hypothetical protein
LFSDRHPEITLLPIVILKELDQARRASATEGRAFSPAETRSRPFVALALALIG